MKKNENLEAPSLSSFTRLTEKSFSPLVIRKYTKFGFPIFVGIITDDDLDALDSIVIDFIKKKKNLWTSDSIQDKRQLAGLLSERITQVFLKTEGVAVTFYIDKACVSSLFGDFMNHFQCKFEYYSLLMMSTNI